MNQFMTNNRVPIWSYQALCSYPEYFVHLQDNNCRINPHPCDRRGGLSIKMAAITRTPYTSPLGALLHS
jgi:hypothetical protein